jgi:hypothetical protein
MNIRFVLQTLGYLVAEIETNGTNIKIGHSSTYGDKFQELLNGFYFIYKTKKDGEFAFFPYSFEVKWYDDRLNYTWIIQTDGVILTIKIFELSNSDSNYKKELLNETVRLQKLFNDIYYSLDLMLREFGLIGYKTNWDVGNFPIFEYLMLKVDRYNIDLNIQELDEDHEWKGKFSLHDEVKLIQLDTF